MPLLGSFVIVAVISETGDTVNAVPLKAANLIAAHESDTKSVTGIVTDFVPGVLVIVCGEAYFLRINSKHEAARHLAV